MIRNEAIFHNIFAQVHLKNREFRNFNKFASLNFHLLVKQDKMSNYKGLKQKVNEMNFQDSNND